MLNATIMHEDILNINVIFFVKLPWNNVYSKRYTYKIAYRQFNDFIDHIHDGQLRICTNTIRRSLWKMQVWSNSL